MNEKLISETEAAELAGVSIETIRRFVQFGLLRVHRKEGERELFTESDAISLFHVRRSSDDSGKPTQPELQTQPPTSHRDPLPTADEPRPLPSVDAQPPESSRAEAQSGSPQQPAATTEPQNTTQTAQTTVIAIPASENFSAASGGEMMELTRTLREQIQILREERDWLRDRVERLEALAERDQLVQMSNAETIRMALTEKPKRSRWLALPWLK